MKNLRNALGRPRFNLWLVIVILAGSVGQPERVTNKVHLILVLIAGCLSVALSFLVRQQEDEELEDEVAEKVTQAIEDGLNEMGVNIGMVKGKTVKSNPKKLPTE